MFSSLSKQILIDQILETYLLQLVQAIRFEGKPTDFTNSTFSANSTSSKEDHHKPAEDPDKSSTLSEFLIERALNGSNDVLATYLYWYLKVEAESGVYENNKIFSEVKDRFYMPKPEKKKEDKSYKNKNQHISPYAENLLAADEDPNFVNLQQKYLNHLRYTSKKEEIYKSLDDQIKLIGDITTAMISSKAEAGNDRTKRQQSLKYLFQAINSNNFRSRSTPGGRLVTLPLNPKIKVRSINTEKISVFKSALMPVRIVFKIDDGSIPAKPTSQAELDLLINSLPEYEVIFKIGDDLRQDQLIVQLINLIDSTLKSDNLDLKLSPYKVLATSQDAGMIELVKDSTPVSGIFKNFNNSILNYLKQENSEDLIEPAARRFSIDSQWFK